MIKSRKYLTPNDVFILFPIVVAVFILVQVVCLFASTVLETLLPLPANMSTQWTIMLSTLSIGLTVIVYALVRRIDLVTITGVSRAPKWSQLACMALILLGVLAIGIPLSNMFSRWLNIDSRGLNIPVGEVLSAGDVMFLLVGVCILPALCEELFMRGVIAIGLARFGKIKASIICGILFMLFHMNALQTVHQTFFGVILAYIMLSGGNIWVCVIMHFTNNFLSLALSSLMPLQLQEILFANMWYVSVIFGIIIVIVGIILYKRVVGQDAYDKDSELTLLNNQTDYNQAIYNVDNGACDTQAIQVQPLEKINIVAIIFFALSVVLCAVLWISSLMT
ncbi:MAG: type II CAAX endopeptidase family protein [Clostridia bacterium]|nr:type II CAAX endopeptidase family protein [Clostridia bacterium]